MGYEKAKKDYENAKSKPEFRLPLITNGEIKAIENRGLTYETCEFFNYKVGTFFGTIKGSMLSNVACHIEEYPGETIYQKIRLPNKRFVWAGDSPDDKLFGEWLFPPMADRFIVVTEGAIDAMSVHQATGYPVVSISGGAQSAFKQIKARLPYLYGFKKVLLWFDTDEPGRAAVQECAFLFDSDKVGTITTPHGLKDANDLLAGGKSDDIKRAIWNHSPIVSANMRVLSEGRIENKNNQLICQWPWPNVEKALEGVRSGYLYAVGAGTGIGKSLLMFSLLKHASESGIASSNFDLEDTYDEALEKYLSAFSGHDYMNYPDAEKERLDILKYKEHLDKISVFVPSESLTIDKFVQIVKLEVRSRDSKIVVLDNITFLTDGGKDMYTDIGHWIVEMKKLAVQLGVAIFVLSHLTKTVKGARSHQEGATVHINDFRGSNAIAAYSNVVIGLERNIEEGNPLTTIRALKGRNKGLIGGPLATLVNKNCIYQETVTVEAAEPVMKQPVQEIETQEMPWDEEIEHEQR